MSEEVKGKTLFDRLYGMTEEVKKAANKPIIMNRLKRKLRSAHDDASSKIIDAEEELKKVQEDLVTFDINGIISSKGKIHDLKDAQRVIRETYVELFGKSMKVEED